ncbi:DUF397 domain-containing protein [Cryptosporangium minutisporangium]
MSGKQHQRNDRVTDLSDAHWRKAKRSTGANTGCVEVAPNLPEVAAVRDSKRPEGGAHVVSRSAFAAFLDDVKAGRYDL